MITLGVMQPRVATKAPGIPATWLPTKVAAFKAMGPGVISAMVTRSVKAAMDSQGWITTTCSRIKGRAARPPPKAKRPTWKKAQYRVSSIRRPPSGPAGWHPQSR